LLQQLPRLAAAAAVTQMIPAQLPQGLNRGRGLSQQQPKLPLLVAAAMALTCCSSMVWQWV
jgi:hypothetical protein